MKRISILGSTGSIGTQALEVLARHPDRFSVVGLAAGGNLKLLGEQIDRFRPRRVSVRTAEDARSLKQSLNGGVGVLWGEEGAREIAGDPEVDLVLSAIVGAAGLGPTYHALSRGRPVALANKESLVIAGEIMTRRARESGVEILPVDSEHSAIFQALSAGRRADARRLILTASGGPFFRRSREELREVTPEEALRHPNWQMGAKITIDSATMMNKGLEVIEAKWLFDFSPDAIAIKVHPESIVHSMVEFCDGSVVAQMGVPDMRCAISYALAYPERIESGVQSLDLTTAGPLSFFESDPETFPAIRLAYEAARVGRSLPAVLNAANEVAVRKFLNREISFPKITRLVERAMERHDPRPLTSLEDVLEADRWGRETAEAL